MRRELAGHFGMQQADGSLVGFRKAHEPKSFKVLQQKGLVDVRLPILQGLLASHPVALQVHRDVALVGHMSKVPDCATAIQCRPVGDAQLRSWCDTVGRLAPGPDPMAPDDGFHRGARNRIRCRGEVAMPAAGCEVRPLPDPLLEALRQHGDARKVRCKSVLLDPSAMAHAELGQHVLPRAAQHGHGALELGVVFVQIVAALLADNLQSRGL
mmetsp:Transcript_17288/g.40947  ORF Transcript_17288/g.40947 Transcript_17288/m.40947 type:complete len:212 (+) Transcript_17288:158-793(+)